MKTPLRILSGLGLLAALTCLSACESLIDENATLDPRVMETPGVDSALEANYPRGSANPNPRY